MQFINTVNFKVLAFFTLAFLFVTCHAQVDDSENAVTVTMEKPKISVFQRTYNSFGSIKSLKTPTIVAQTAGNIMLLHKKIGDDVYEGEVLATLDDTIPRINYEKALAALDATKARIANQKATIMRLTTLRNKNSLSQSGLDEASTKLEELEAKLRVETEDLNAAKYNLDKTQIVSPISGIIQGRKISQGDYAVVGTPIYTLVAANDLQAELPIPQTVAKEITGNVLIELDTPTSEKKITQSKHYQTPMANTATRNFMLYMDFTNPGDWYAGTSVNAIIYFSPREVLSISPLSIMVDDEKSYVFVIDKNNKVSKTEVTLGDSYNNKLEVISGLSINDLIVKEGVHLLNDKALIQAKV